MTINPDQFQAVIVDREKSDLKNIPLTIHN